MKNPMDLAGRTILVTGASSGIGRAAAILLSELGARLVLTARNKGMLEQTQAHLAAGDHRIIPCDLGVLDNIPEYMREVRNEVGPLHGFVHSAGVGTPMPLRSLSSGEAEDIMRINFTAALVLTREFSRKQIRSESASIVFVSSVAGSVGVAARSAYSASKGALIAFARSAAIELVNSRIRVNCVAPAYVRTEMFERAAQALPDAQWAEQLERTHPLGIGEPLDVAHAIAFLLADTGRWITGSVLTVDGGYTAQ